MQEGLNNTVSETPLLKLENISKRFPGVSALSKVNFDLREGEVHVLFGENGAGKSTLINIVAGALRPSREDFVPWQRNAFSERSYR